MHGQQNFNFFADIDIKISHWVFLRISSHKGSPSGKECQIVFDWLINNWFPALAVLMYLGLKNAPFVPHNLIPVQGSLVPLLKFQMAPGLKLLKSFGSKKKEPRYTCLSETKSSHSQRMWADLSSCAPRLPHKRLLVSPIKWRCLLRVLCPVRRPLTTLVCVSLKDISLILAVWVGPEINSRSWSLSNAKTSPVTYRCISYLFYT